MIRSLVAAFAIATAIPAVAQTIAITGGTVALGDGSEPIQGGTVLIGLSGRGDKDMPTLQQTLIASLEGDSNVEIQP